ncbi:MAG: ATP-dependent helicase [Treponema sp.]|nr:ATP-dependent helicase [Treponema sp.]
MTDSFPSYLEPLNSGQRQAVLHTGKPLLILAGAGSGKTRVITTKIAWLIRERGVDPRSILAVTFTNKAAREMAQRARRIDERAAEAMMRTFHSFGAWFLRRNGNLAGLDSGFVIYDDDDIVSLLSSIMENSAKAEVRYFARCVSRAKDYFLSPDDPELDSIEHDKRFRGVYRRYEERMSQIGNVDFGDLIKKPAEILRNNPEVAARFHQRFSVIMVDEYQDANVAQFRLLKELCGPYTYVCVVGDDDQSIYRFRGAEVKNILEFPDKFSGADIIRLEQNYRSTAPILKAASSVVDFNQSRLGKTLYAEKGNGPLPVLAHLPDQSAEAAFCADRIETSVKSGKSSWADWAVLYRTNAQSLGFETLFLKRGIPYRVVGSLKFYEREEIKDALALLAFLVNPRDEVAFRRVVNKPARGAGGVSVDKIVEAAVDDGVNIIEAGNKVELSAKARKGFDRFIKVIKDAQSCLQADSSSTQVPDTQPPVSAPDKKKSKSKKNAAGNKEKAKYNKLKSGTGLSVCIEQLLIDSGIAEYHEMQDEYSGNSKIGNLQELLNGASDYPNDNEGLLKFLEDIELDRSMNEEAAQAASADKQNNILDTVTLITFHNTKGLEFKHVIMTGLENCTFPRDDKKDDELEEERRLFYVGATRAMDELYFTTCSQRRMFGKTIQASPSIFLREIDKSCLNEYGSTGKINYGYVNRPQSFNAFNLRSINETASGNSQISDAEERSGWRRGQRIFNDNYGYGAVMEVKDSEDGPLVRVRFDNGHEKRFLSEIQGRAYEKVGDDY